MKTFKILMLSGVFLLTYVKLMSQQVFVAGGGNIKSGEGSVSYTVGQIADETITNAGITIYEGVQQPYEIFIISATKETDITITLSPNPAMDFVALKTDKILENMSARLYDVAGKELLVQYINENETIIPLESLKSSAYFLVIFTDSFQIKNYTIIKQ